MILPFECSPLLSDPVEAAGTTVIPAFPDYPVLVLVFPAFSYGENNAVMRLNRPSGTASSHKG